MLSLSKITPSAIFVEEKVKEGNAGKKASYASLLRAHTERTAQTASVGKKLEKGNAGTKASSQRAQQVFSFEVEDSQPGEGRPEEIAQSKDCGLCGSNKSRAESAFFGSCSFAEEQTERQTKEQTEEQGDCVHIGREGPTYVAHRNHIQSEGLVYPWIGLFAESPSPSSASR